MACVCFVRCVVCVVYKVRCGVQCGVVWCAFHNFSIGVSMMVSILWCGASVCTLLYSMVWSDSLVFFFQYAGFDGL